MLELVKKYGTVLLYSLLIFGLFIQTIYGLLNPTHIITLASIGIFVALDLHKLKNKISSLTYKIIHLSIVSIATCLCLYFLYQTKTIINFNVSMFGMTAIIAILTELYYKNSSSNLIEE